ncbi:MFS transporter [Gemmatimonas sp.]|jgi:ACS family glucarate transporter-like MFS transporter|uniref:MFS transporter n=2 Tax=Gemmatimonas sp. TaxID=1962908 RepID=UPI00391EF375
MSASDSPSSSRRVVWLLALMGLVAYALRTNIAIAQEYLAPELGLTMVQMGVISAWGFQLAYTLGQVPGGAMGDRHGARLVLAVASLGWAVASLASGAVMGSGMVAFAGLFAARVLLGASQAATYPVSAVAVARHVPEGGRTAASAIYLAASTLGAALAPLTLTPLMARAGWRAVFLASAAVGVAAAVTWFVLAPRDRPAPVSPAAMRGAPSLWQQTGRLLQNASLRRLCAAYLLHSAVLYVFFFWFFRYLIEARGFTLLETGVWASLPYLLATVAAPLAGMLADRLAQRVGLATARRRVAISGLTLAALLVLTGAWIPTPTLAIVALSLSAACLISCEAPFWTTAAALGREGEGAATGVLNLMGNVGGILSIWLVPLMKDAWGWFAMLAFWAAVALVAAALFASTGRDDRIGTT